MIDIGCRVGFQWIMEIMLWTVSLAKRESGYWMFEGLILANQLATKIDARGSGYKSNIALFCNGYFYGWARTNPIDRIQDIRKTDFNNRKTLLLKETNYTGIIQA